MEAYINGFKDFSFAEKVFFERLSMPNNNKIAMLMLIKAGDIKKAAIKRQLTMVTKLVSLSLKFI